MANPRTVESSIFDAAIDNGAVARMPCMEVWSRSQLTTSAIEFGGLDHSEFVHLLNDQFAATSPAGRGVSSYKDSDARSPTALPDVPDPRVR
jgi:hypothetical protein